GLVPQQVEVVGHEREGVDEVLHAARLRAQGVSTRWSPTRRASATSASTTAAMNSVLNDVCSAAKIGEPSPLSMTNAATVASEITVTVATRSPATIAGSASGS